MKKLTLTLFFLSLVIVANAQIRFKKPKNFNHFSMNSAMFDKQPLARGAVASQIDSSIQYIREAGVLRLFDFNRFTYYPSGLLKTLHHQYHDGNKWVDNYKVHYTWDSLNRIKQLHFIDLQLNTFNMSYLLSAKYTVDNEIELIKYEWYDTLTQTYSILSADSTHCIYNSNNQIERIDFYSYNDTTKTYEWTDRIDSIQWSAQKTPTSMIITAGYNSRATSFMEGKLENMEWHLGFPGLYFFSRALGSDFTFPFLQYKEWFFYEANSDKNLHITNEGEFYRKPTNYVLKKLDTSNNYIWERRNIATITNGNTLNVLNERYYNYWFNNFTWMPHANINIVFNQRGDFAELHEVYYSTSPGYYSDFGKYYFTYDSITGLRKHIEYRAFDDVQQNWIKSYECFYDRLYDSNQNQTDITIYAKDTNSIFAFDSIHFYRGLKGGNNTTSTSKLDFNIKAQLYPNPADDMLCINTQHPIVAVSVFDLTGRTLLQIETNNSSQQLSLSTQALPIGMYILNIQTEQGNIKERFVKK